jgi:hypothetical protein
MMNETITRIHENTKTILKHLAAIADHTKPEWGVGPAHRNLIGQDIIEAMGACSDILFVTDLEAARRDILEHAKKHPVSQQGAATSKPASKRKAKKATKRAAKA